MCISEQEVWLGILYCRGHGDKLFWSVWKADKHTTNIMQQAWAHNNFTSWCGFNVLDFLENVSLPEKLTTYWIRKQLLEEHLR